MVKLPKKPILEVLTTLEEEIEVIATDDKQTVSGKGVLNDNSRRWKFVLPGRYLLAILLFYIVNVIKVYFVISHVDTTVIVPMIYDPLNVIEANTNAVIRQCFDVIDTTDNITYSSGKAAGHLRTTIEHLKDELIEMTTMLGAHIPPRGSDSDPIYKLWRKGACFLPTDAECETYPYENDIGYTKELTMSGLEHQIFTYIKVAEAFLDNKDYLQNTTSKSFKLLEKMMWLFYEVKPPSSLMIVDQYNKYAGESTITATAALFSLASCVFASFGIYYYIGFSQASRKFSGNNRLLVCLVFSINQNDRMKNQELNTFVESSGASVN